MAANHDFPRHRAKPALRLSPSGFLLDGQNGESYTINRTGAFILRALLDGRPSGEVWRDVAEAFEVSEVTARRDTFRFLGELTRLGVVKTDDEDEANEREDGDA